MERHEIETLTREELVALAEELGIARPRALTMPELVDEIVTRTARSEVDRARSRGWLGRARDLLAGVIERGLHMPDIARAVRQSSPAPRPFPSAPMPLATVTLAEIYASQGHLEKALLVLDEVLAREPEHTEARALRKRLTGMIEPVAEAEAEPETAAETEAVAAAVAGAAAEAEAAAEAVAGAEAEAEAEAVAEAEAEAVAQAVAQTEAAIDTVANVEVAASPVEEKPAPEAATETEDDKPAWISTAADTIEVLPLPERYNVDEIVAISVDPTTIYLYWEVRPTSFARARAKNPEGALVIRTAIVTPSWEGPIVEQRDVRIDALYGDAYLRNVRPGSDIRMSVGWSYRGSFEPFAIGAEVATARKEPVAGSAQQKAVWDPTRAADVLPENVPELVRAAWGLPSASSLASQPTPDAPSPFAGAPSLASVPPAVRAALGDRWPTFDLGSRGVSAPQPARQEATSSWGGSSEQVRPAER